MDWSMKIAMLTLVAGLIVAVVLGILLSQAWSAWKVWRRYRGKR